VPHEKRRRGYLKTNTRHSRASGNPGGLYGTFGASWIPACAGMTQFLVLMIHTVSKAARLKRGITDKLLDGMQRHG